MAKLWRMCLQNMVAALLFITRTSGFEIFGSASDISDCLPMVRFKFIQNRLINDPSSGNLWFNKKDGSGHLVSVQHFRFCDFNVEHLLCSKCGSNFIKID